MDQGTCHNNQGSSVTRNSKIKFWQLNCNSLNKSKLVECKNILSVKNPTIMCLQEAWWCKPIITNFKGYEMDRIDQEKTESQHSKVGGAAILINLEVVILKCIRINGAFYAVANIYNNNG